MSDPIRDFGGVPVEGGGRVRSGLLFRSEAPANLNEHGRAQLAALPLRSLIDLRGHGEGADFDGPWHDNTPPVRLPLEVVSANRALDPDLGLVMLRDPSGRVAHDYMREFFVELVDAFARGPLQQFVETVIEPDRVPMLVHCTAGRDRTGTFVAMLLAALGVARHQILADYLQGNIFYGPDRVRDLIFGLIPEPFEGPYDPASLAPLSAQEEYLDLVFATIVERHGSVAHYWRSASGNKDIIALLRDRLTE